MGPTRGILGPTGVEERAFGLGKRGWPLSRGSTGSVRSTPGLPRAGFASGPAHSEAGVLRYGCFPLPAFQQGLVAKPPELARQLEALRAAGQQVENGASRLFAREPTSHEALKIAFSGVTGQSRFL